jgi:hypothetical protein
VSLLRIICTILALVTSSSEMAEEAEDEDKDDHNYKGVNLSKYVLVLEEGYFNVS